MAIETIRLKRRLVVGAPPGPPPALKGPVGALRLPSPGKPVAPPFAPSRVEPKAKVLAMRTFNMICPGPRPKLRGRICSPAVGFGSSNPYFVDITPGLPGSVAMPGRALNSVSPYKSRPTVISNGGPDSTTNSGLIRKFHFELSDPPTVTRLCTSVAAGPYSPAKLYGFAGNVESPSVLLMARL